MAQPKTTIELNGKLYDASTGEIVKNAAVKKPIGKPASKPGAAMDGFFRRPGQAASQPTKPAKAPRQARATAKAPGRQPERSHTLMRHVVRKPSAAAPVVSPAKAKSDNTTSQPSRHLQARQARASQVTKSSLVSRFGNSASSAVSKKLAPLAVRPHPEAAQHDALQNIAPPIGKAATKTSTNSFEKALESASSHRQAPLKAQKLRHRVAKKLGVKVTTVSVVSAALVILLLAGFTAYQNAPNISMHLAGARAGFNASLPGYTPGGFGIAGPIKTGPGSVTVSFRSHSDDRSYDITQKPSNWTSDSLRTNFFASTDSPTAYQDKGKTIYLYNNGSSAAWVNGGILYQITGNAGLSSDQVVNIADSL